MSYKINWDNNTEACGTFPESYATEKEAEQAARAWKREMVAIEPTEYAKRKARSLYQWEVIEVEDEPDPEGEGWVDEITEHGLHEPLSRRGE